MRNITAKGATNLMQDGWILLDVRPPSEIEKAAVIDAVEVPVFLPDDRLDIGSLLKQMSAFGMGGWWLGGTHMEPNKEFLNDVQKRIPKDAKVIVACQKGLRSLAACEQLSRAGYQSLAWVNGGFDTAKPGDISSKEDKDLRLAGIGGVSEMLGWTQLQQEGKKGLGDRVENILKLAGVIVAADLLVLAYEQIKYMTSQ